MRLGCAGGLQTCTLYSWHSDGWSQLDEASMVEAASVTELLDAMQIWNKRSGATVSCLRGAAALFKLLKKIEVRADQKCAKDVVQRE